MRRVDRSIVPKPAALISAPCIHHLNLIIANPSTVFPKDDFCKGKERIANNIFVFTVTIALKKLYKNKCAYCEKMCFSPRVEHFRPKKRVTGNQLLPNGYYWLCYEWTNLLPSCHDCNSIEAKSDKFPIKSLRKNTFPVSGIPPALDATQNIFNSPYLTSEDPLFIHPEYCSDFWNHFDFDRTGEMIPLSDYGLQTIVDLKLSDDDRNGWRREIYEKYYNRFLNLVRRYKRNVNPLAENIFDEELEDLVIELVENSQNEELSYTLFRKCLIKKIDYFFIDPLESAFQKEIKSKIVKALLSLA